MRLLALALILVRAGCGTANKPEVAAPAPSEVAAQLRLPTVKAYGPIAGEGALWLRDVAVTIDTKTNHVVERAAIQGPGGAAGADGTLWVSSRSKLLRLPG